MWVVPVVHKCISILLCTTYLCTVYLRQRCSKPAPWKIHFSQLSFRGAARRSAACSVAASMINSKIHLFLMRRWGHTYWFFSARRSAARHGVRWGHTYWFFSARRGALKKVNFTVYHSRGYTASRAAPRNESWVNFIFHSAAFFKAQPRSVGSHLNSIVSSF